MLELWYYQEEWTGYGMLVGLLAVFVAFIMRLIFLTTLQRIIEQLDKENIDYNPTWNWLSILPVVHYIFDFFLTFKYRNLLQIELEEQGLSIKYVRPMFWFGFAYCVLNLLMLFDSRLFLGYIGLSAQACGFICFGMLLDFKIMLKRNNSKKGKKSLY